jgi:alpha-aminoadipate/glutamate carrier protein LysW
LFRRVLVAVCPECDAEIEIDEFDVDKGEIISCPECGVDLEVVGLAPLDLDLAPREEDDWEE